MSRLRSSLERSERGFTTIELMIVLVIMSIAVLAITNSLSNATEAAAFAQRKNESLDDLRVMAAAFAKDVRQGVEASVASASTITFETYLDGALHEVTWRASTSTETDRLERSVDGTVTSVYVVDLTTTSIFSYFGAVDPSTVSRVRVALATQPDDGNPAVEVATEVEMRNVA